MKFLYYTKDQDGSFVFWKQGYGYTSLAEATVFNGIRDPGAPDHLSGVGRWFPTDTPETALFQLQVIDILEQFQDTNLASRAGREHVARQLASKLTASRFYLKESEALRVAQEIGGLCHDYQQAPWASTVEDAWAILAAVHSGMVNEGYLFVLPLTGGQEDALG